MIHSLIKYMSLRTITGQWLILITHVSLLKIAMTHADDIHITAHNYSSMMHSNNLHIITHS